MKEEHTTMSLLHIQSLKLTSFAVLKKKSLNKWAELEDMEEFTLSFRENNLYA